MREHPSGYGDVPKPARHAKGRTPLPSERVVVAAPMSFAGSAQRLWLLAGSGQAGGGRGAGLLKALLYTGVILGIIIAWAVVLAWYLIWGIWLIPYRLIRRGRRKRRLEGLRHREMLAAIQGRQDRELP